MPSIHLLNKATSPLQPEEVSAGISESGLWRVSTERAESLKGHPIHFHRRKADAAFLSAIVTDYRRELYNTDEGRTTMRTVFIFAPTADPGAVFTGPEGWTPAGVKYIS
jgi:hypothetical protein